MTIPIIQNLSNLQKQLNAAFDAKQGLLVSGTNIKTINGSSVLGSGNLVISASAAWGGITGTLSAQTDLQTALDLLAPKASPAFTGGITTPLIGLNSVASDPASPTDGQIWYNSTTNKLRACQFGSNFNVIGVPVFTITTTVAPTQKNIGAWEHEAVIVDATISASSKIQLSLAATLDTDENEAELLDVVSMVGTPGSGQFTLKMSFGGPEVGPIKLNYWVA